MIIFARGLLLLGLATLAQPVMAAEKPEPVAPQTQAALDALFKTNSRAVLILKDGLPVVTRYAPGFGPQNRFISWSMAKSVTGTAVGILIEQGRLKLDAPAPVPAWHNKPGDPRAAITLRHLINMSAGLEHDENGPPVEKAVTTQMLYGPHVDDVAAFAEAKPLVHTPGHYWQYSTPTSMILADIVTRTITSETDPARRRAIVKDWFEQNMFHPMGIATAEWEFDRVGTFLGGSLIHMSAADWARLGDVYRNNGLWEGRQIIPQAWIKLARTPAPAANNGHYGGQMWLNIAPKGAQRPATMYPHGPRDAFMFLGHLGQYVIISPSQHLVVVRLGKTPDKELGPVRAALGTLLDSFPLIDHP